MLGLSKHGVATKLGKSRFLNALAQLPAELRRILMAMLGDGMRNGDVQNLFFGIGGYRDGAFAFAWKIAAVDRFASHTILFHRGRNRPR